MAIGAKLELRQAGTLAMTQQLQQSIKLLQLSSMELSEFIAQECEQNPLLTRDDGAGEEVVAHQEEGSQTEDVVEFGENHETEIDTPREAVWDDAEAGAFSPSAQMHTKGGHSSEDSDLPDFIANVGESLSLQDHLRTQLQMEIIDPAMRIIGLHMIDLVDERGYVPEDLSPISEALHCAAEEIEAVLIQLQAFEPSGVFARNLVECLSIQLRDRDRLDPAMQTLLMHLDILAAGDVKRLAKLCSVDAEDITQMREEIRALNPKPGYAYGFETIQSVIPDVFLRKTPDGGWTVEMNPDALPKMLVNRQYYAKIAGSVRVKEDKKYLSEQLAHANWITKALDQRAETILKVSTEIVRQQDAFFRHGVRFFKPLILRDIAHEIGLHESTVSRVTTQKYLSTGSAVYELKYFFSSALASTDGGEVHSSESVKHLLRNMIEKETPSDILSDDSIAEKLKAHGIDIARRTVAKYREAIGIGSSSERRKHKKGQTYSHST